MCWVSPQRGQRRLSLPLADAIRIMARMPRSPHTSQAGYCYYVLNRGNGRRTIFHKGRDFAAWQRQEWQSQPGKGRQPADLTPAVRQALCDEVQPAR